MKRTYTKPMIGKRGTLAKLSAQTGDGQQLLSPVQRAEEAAGD